MSTSHNDDDVNSSPQSQEDSPTDNDKGKSPLEASTSSGQTRLSMHRKECRTLFQRLLGRRENTKTASVQASALHPMMKNLGMASEITPDELCDMLKLPGYADETGAVNFEWFRVFAKDFMLLESLSACKSAWAKKKIDQGPVGDFFEALESTKELGFMTFDFHDAFAKLDVEIAEESADILVRYSNLHTAVKITFEQFLKVLNKEHAEYLQRTGQTTLSLRTYTLDKSSRAGRLMLFASAYTRSHHVSRGPASVSPEL